MWSDSANLRQGCCIVRWRSLASRRISCQAVSGNVNGRGKVIRDPRLNLHQHQHILTAMVCHRSVHDHWQWCNSSMSRNWDRPELTTFQRMLWLTYKYLRQPPPLLIFSMSTDVRLVTSSELTAEPFSHGTGTLRCLQKEMATYRHWSVSLWRDPDDVSHCRILSPDKTEWRLISATLCGWGRCFVADQLW